MGSAMQSKGFKINTDIIVDGALIGTTSSAKNAEKARDPEMHQTHKVQQGHFSLKLHIGMDSQKGWAHSAVVTPANVHDKHPLPDLLYGDEQLLHGALAYASQKNLIHSAVPNAKDFTIQRTRRKDVKNVVLQGQKPQRVQSSCAGEARLRCVQANVRFWQCALSRTSKTYVPHIYGFALANICLSRQRLVAQVRPEGRQCLLPSYGLLSVGSPLAAARVFCSAGKKAPTRQ